MNEVESLGDADAVFQALTWRYRHQRSLLRLDLVLKTAVHTARKAGQSEEVLSTLATMREQVRSLLVEERQRKTD